MLRSTWVYEFMVPIISSFGYIFRSKISGSHGNSLFNFLRTHRSVFYSSCAILHSTTTRVLISPHPHQYLLFSVFENNRPHEYGAPYFEISRVLYHLSNSGVMFLKLLCIPGIKIAYVLEKMKQLLDSHLDLCSFLVISSMELLEFQHTKCNLFEPLIH